ncbi:MAG TPA: cytochrome o ubiquinol oxidase subunit I [Candidatus Paceibacterota bacterium]|nr:cytochrome o ubiquinol oxidase subunit I [Candidatus Paceibacterota bacterium]
MLGKLTIDALPHDPIVIGASIFMVVVGLIIVGLLYRYDKFGWLWREWLTSLDPKRIGVMYIIVSFVMLFRGFSDAVMMRVQQALSVGASHGYLEPSHFQQIFTAHGTIMIFFVAMGLMWGLFNVVVPLQIGARDVAFPFLNSLSFWLFVSGAVLMNLSLVLGDFAKTGWLAYPPLSELAYSPDVGVDYWIWALQISGLGSLLSGVNFFTTILTMRCPGMTLMRMPVFVWTTLCSTALVILAFPILTATLAMLFLDRFADFHFFTSTMGGNPMMYVNLIWAWGHPEVYILVLPAFGVFSEVVPAFSQKRLFGYTSMVFATAGITFFSFVVWLHHFFTMGAGANVNAFFGIMTMIIAIPTGVKVFNWLFTMFRGRIIFSSMMHWFLGFVATFTLGGVTGVLMAVPAADFQLHNSLFLVAHFHNMIIGGVVFGYFAGMTYWFPKIFGFTLNERLGKAAFWSWIIGFFLAFVPLYILGFMGATRRLDHYDASLGWQSLFIVAAIGVAVIGLGVLFQVAQYVVSIRDRRKHRDVTGDPWNGRNLEWSTASPAPFYNFARIPRVYGRDAWWADKQSEELNAQGPYEDIELPKNSPAGLYIGVATLAIGFGLVWHIAALVLIGALVALGLLIARTLDDDTERVIPAAEVERMDREFAKRRLDLHAAS